MTFAAAAAAAAIMEPAPSTAALNANNGSNAYVGYGGANPNGTSSPLRSRYEFPTDWAPLVASDAELQRLRQQRQNKSGRDARNMTAKLSAGVLALYLCYLVVSRLVAAARTQSRRRGRGRGSGKRAASPRPRVRESSVGEEAAGLSAAQGSRAQLIADHEQAVHSADESDGDGVEL